MAIKDSITIGISKLAKSVENGASSIAKKSGEVVEVSKLNLSISYENNKINNLYKTIGEIVFQKYKNGEIISKELEESCRYIFQCENNIKEYMNRIEEIRGNGESDDDDLIK